MQQEAQAEALLPKPIRMQEQIIKQETDRTRNCGMRWGLLLCLHS